MARYAGDFITQVVVRADSASGTAPMTAEPPEGILTAVENYPERSVLTRSRTEVRVQKTPQGPVRDTWTINFPEHNFWSADKNLHAAVCGEYVFLAQRQYEGYALLREEFLALLGAVSGQFPGLSIKRLGRRYVNEIKLPEAEVGPVLGGVFCGTDLAGTGGEHAGGGQRHSRRGGDGAGRAGKG